MRLHIGPLHLILTMLELLILWIPIKLVAFSKAKDNQLAAAVAYGL